MNTTQMDRRDKKKIKNYILY